MKFLMMHCCRRPLALLSRSASFPLFLYPFPFLEFCSLVLWILIGVPIAFLSWRLAVWNSMIANSFRLACEWLFFYLQPRAASFSY
jgi:hypothetical protein